MQFKTPFEFSKSEFKTAVGSFTRPTYKAVLEKDGQVVPKEDGVELTYEKIQSFKDSVDINLIVSRYAAGDLSALEQRTGAYGDFIEVPSSYMDVLNTVVEMRNAYEKSGSDISFEAFVNNALRPVYEPSETINIEVIADEQKPE